MIPNPDLKVVLFLNVKIYGKQRHLPPGLLLYTCSVLFCLPIDVIDDFE